MCIVYIFSYTKDISIVKKKKTFKSHSSQNHIEGKLNLSEQISFKHVSEKS